jgi:hypothetical protein
MAYFPQKTVLNNVMQNPYTLLINYSVKFGLFLLLFFDANIHHSLKLRNRKFQEEIKDTLYLYEDFGQPPHNFWDKETP